MTARLPHVDALAAGLADRVLSCAPRLGRTRLVAVEGPAGSGKTTLAAAMDRSLRDLLRTHGSPAGRAQVRTIHMDNLYPGWTGLEAGLETLAGSVVAPLAAGEPGRYRRWDWHRDGFAEERVVEACDVLVVEGVGSGCSAVAAHLSLLVWVETASVVRLERGLARDGVHLREHFLAFRAQEDAMFARERTRDRADVLVDGTTGFAPRPPT